MSAPLLSRVVEHYHRTFCEREDARGYLAERGLTDVDVLKAFKIGYADGSFLKAVPKAGDVRDELKALGVVTQEGRELLGGCIVVPIPDPLTGGWTTLYGRGVRTPRHCYLTGPLRGVLNFQAARSSSEVILTESVLDALSFHQVGVGTAIPLYGTNGFTGDHLDLLKREGVKRVILALDGDAPGRKATAALKEKLSGLGIAVRVMDYPPNVKDPNELLVSCNGNAADVFHRMLDEAEPRPAPKPTPASARPQAVAPQAAAPSAAPKPPPRVAPTVTAAPTPEPMPTSGRTPAAAPTPASPLAVMSVPSSHLTEKPVEVSASREGGHNAITTPSPGPGDSSSQGHVEAPSSGPADGSLTLRRDGITYRARGCSLALGRLRATVKAERGAAFHVDTLDLYASRSRAEFARRAAKTLGSQADTVEQHLLSLLVEVEKVAEQGDGAPTEAATGPPPMTDTERQEALTFLRRPDLLDQVGRDIDALGYVGERALMCLLYLIAISRKLEDPCSGIVLSGSGAGKSGATEVVERLTPPEDVVLFTRLTPQSLYYTEPGFLDRKLVIVEERYGSMEADYSIRVLQSRKKLIAAAPIKDPQTGNMRTKVFTVEARAAFIEATTASSVNHENATRCFELSMDESPEQTKRIHERQRVMRTERGLGLRQEAEAIIRRHWSAQRLLEPLPVVIPFADKLSFPDAWMRTRRDHARFLNLIEVSAFLHQYQRERRNGAIVASVADYAVAYGLAAEVLTETLSDLKKPLRDALERIRGLCSEGDGTISRREIREVLALPDSTVRHWLCDLVELEYLEAEASRGGAGKTTRYRLAERGPRGGVTLGLLSPEDLSKVLARGR